MPKNVTDPNIGEEDKVEEVEVSEEIIKTESGIAEDFKEVEAEVTDADADEAEAIAAAIARADAEKEAEAEEKFEPVDKDLTIADPPGIVTERSPELFKKLREAWLGAGKPRNLTAYGTVWTMYDGGKRFVARSGGAWEQMYGSTSIGRR